MGAKNSAIYEDRSDARRRILNLCFDQESMNNLSTGLKLLILSDQPPLLVQIQEKQNKDKKVV